MMSGWLLGRWCFVCNAVTVKAGSRPVLEHAVQYAKLRNTQEVLGYQTANRKRSADGPVQVVSDSPIESCVRASEMLVGARKRLEAESWAANARNRL